MSKDNVVKVVQATWDHNADSGIYWTTSYQNCVIYNIVSL
jgi:hypothetical protein